MNGPKARNVSVEKGLKSTEAVKTATRENTMSSLSRFVIYDKVQHVTLVRKSRDLMAVVWVDRDRMYFVG